jgi:UDP-glucose 4-epimerase
MMELKRVVLTGATGVLGTALIDKLIEKGAEIFIVCHPQSKRNRFIRNHKNIHKVFCDLQEIKNLPTLISVPCDAFFHFAWLGTENPNNRMNMSLQEENIRYALQAVSAAREIGCKVFVGAGSQAEYGRVSGIIHPDTPTFPVSGYGMAKLCTGQMTRETCKQYGIRHIWPRILSIYGPHDGGHTLISTVIDSLLKGKKPALTAGEQIWDYLYAGDAAEALIRMALLGHDGSVYVLGSGKTRKLREFMEIIRDTIDSKLPLGIGEIPYYPDQAMHLEADITSLYKDTKWLPTTEFTEGIRMLIEERKNAAKKCNTVH